MKRKPNKGQVLQEIKDILKKYDAEIAIEMRGNQWSESPCIILYYSTFDFNCEEIDLGTAIIP